MHLQEIFDPRSRSHEALPSTSCDLCTCKVGSCYGKWLRKCITKKNTLFDLDPKVTQNVAQYPRHHVTCEPAKFDVATSHGKGEDAFTRKYII